MEFEISLADLRFYSFHGVFDVEKDTGNEFKVNLMVKIPCDASNMEDDLEGTLNYAALYGIVEEEMSKPRNLMETVALEVVRRIKINFPQVKSGRIEIEKSRPPIRGMLGRAKVALVF